MRSTITEAASRSGERVSVVSALWVQTDMGGPDARLTAAETVSAMRRLIDKLGPAQSGKFFNHDAREYAW